MSLDFFFYVYDFSSLFVQAVYLYYCIFVFLVCKNLRIDVIFFITCNHTLKSNFGGMQSPFEISHICICLLEKENVVWTIHLSGIILSFFFFFSFFGPFTKAPINNSFHVWKDQMQMFIQLLGNHQNLNLVMHF